jgi:hypothetical protein
MTLVMDAGALLALEKNDRAMWLRFTSDPDDLTLLASHASLAARLSPA